MIPTVLGFVNNWGFSTQVHLHFCLSLSTLGFLLPDLGWWKSKYGGLPSPVLCGALVQVKDNHILDTDFQQQMT